MTRKFIPICKITAARSRREVYRAGDVRTVGLALSLGGTWLVRAYNDRDERVNSLVNWNSRSWPCAKLKARQFARSLETVV